MIRTVHRLPWSVVDPTSVPFDPAPAYAIVRKHVATLRAGEFVQAARGRYERDLDLDLVAHYGAWASGWNWTPSEGGPVHPPPSTGLREDTEA